MRSPAPLLMLVGTLVTGLIACSDKDDEDEGGDDTGGLACGSTQGFVYGTVWTEAGTPVVGADVVAEDDRGHTVEAEMGEAGTYELNVEGGTWTIQARDPDRCASEPVTADVPACTELELDFTVPDEC